MLESTKVRLLIAFVITTLAVAGASYVNHYIQKQKKIEQVTNFIIELEKINLSKQ